MQVRFEHIGDTDSIVVHEHDFGCAACPLVQTLRVSSNRPALPAWARGYLCFRLTLEAQYFVPRESYSPSDVGRLQASCLPHSANGHRCYFPTHSQFGWGEEVGEEWGVVEFHGDTHYSMSLLHVALRLFIGVNSGSVNLGDFAEPALWYRG